MEVQFGMQPNCSEIVYQICGVHTDNVKEFKEKLFDILQHKYATPYLSDYMARLCAIEEKYCLNLTDSCDDWGALCKVADQMDNVHADYVSCCSDYIDSDSQMEDHMKWREEKNESEGFEAD
jgi:hypothetical protein